MTETTSTPVQLRVQRLRPDAELPSRAHPADAGLDLVAVDSLTLAAAGGRATVGTGIAVEVPQGWAGLVCRRSGLASRHGVTVLGGTGVIDAGYSGEVRVVLINTDPDQAFEVHAGDRIAQLVLTPVMLGDVLEVGELARSARSTAGFGSTGGFG